MPVFVSGATGFFGPVVNGSRYDGDLRFLL